jgi:crotonobetainyl-CoA:carnitine CoA-transferase CaiB-like acyl-CoA transferase
VTALEGLKVLDLSRVLAGPWATQMLADLGAEVIKIEKPGAGDDTRAWGPPFLAGADGGAGEAAYFTSANRGKQSVTVDIAKPRGAQLVRELAARADVVVENFKVGGLARYGLDYPSLSALNPRLVYCSITGFGQDGPNAARAGYDYVIQAMAGMMSVTGQPDGTPGGEPMRAGVAVADLFSGLYAASAILAALLNARATGVGQHIDIALFDVQAAVLANQAANFFATDTTPVRVGNRHPNLVPYQVFTASDAAFVVAVGNDQQFRSLCAALDAAHLADDARFASNQLRIEHRLALTAVLAAIFALDTASAWERRLEAVGVPCGPINDVREVFASPQALARGLVVEQRRGDLAQPVRGVASPMRLSATPVAYRRPPPALGADTAQVLRELLGLTQAEIDELVRAGVV